MSDRIGRRSGRPTYLQRASRSDSEKLVTIEARPGKNVTGWSMYSSDTYLAPFLEMYGGVVIDVVGVVAQSDPSLTRVESASACDSTPGSYYYDPDAVATTAKWDDGVSVYDAALPLWDQVPFLYVHLTDGSDASNRTIMAELGFYFSSKGEVHPSLGPTKITNGSLTNWTSSTVITGFTNNNGSGGTVNREAAIIPTYSLTYSARCNLTSGTSQAWFGQSVTDFVPGKHYRVYGYYRGSYCKLKVMGGPGSTTQEMLPDGRNFQTISTGFTLDDTGTQWRRFVFDFIMPSTWTVASVEYGAYGALSDNYLAGVDYRRIFRWDYYAPRVESNSIPTVKMGANDIFFGGKPIGVGDVTLANGEGWLDRALGAYDWANRTIKVVSGFGWDQQSASSGNTGPTSQSIDDRRVAFTGLVQSIDWSDDEISLKLEDIRSLFNVDLPTALYDDISFGGVDQAFQGRPRPLFFGAKQGISPIRISKDGSTLLGTYEIADCTRAPNGIKAIDKIWSYFDTDAATTGLSTARIGLVSGTDYSSDLANGRFTILRNVSVLAITVENNQVSFNIGGGEITSTVTVGLYTPNTLATELQTRMTATAGVTITVTYSNSTHKFTISKASGTLTLLTKTYSTQIPIWDNIGFAKDADLSGALTYTGSISILTEVDRQHILRVNAQGYKDDASGTYTGSASALVEAGGDIIKMLLVRWMNKPFALIDTATFAASKSRAPESCCIYLNDISSSRTIIETVEASNIGNFTVGGDGTAYYEVYAGAIPLGIKHLMDDDFIRFTVGQSVADVYGTVRVLHDQNPTSGAFESRSATNESVAIRFGRPDTREMTTYLKIADNALATAQRVLELTKSAKRVLNFTVKGHLLDHRPGNKIKITRKRALDIGGKISATVFRIIALEHSFLDASTNILAVDDVVTVAGIACVSACQSLCEATCQASCQSACQASCETSCQVGCQSGCQEACQSACQATCEVTCQTSCQAGCQTGCQVSCQTGCEGGGCQAACQSGCQTSCQTTCQTGCETSCQSACQAACQSACQSACQTGCETACQTGCQTTCQTTCQSSCQTSCETGCQTSCEVTCQTNCQSTCQTQSENILLI